MSLNLIKNLLLIFLLLKWQEFLSNGQVVLNKKTQENTTQKKLSLFPKNDSRVEQNGEAERSSDSIIDLITDIKKNLFLLQPLDLCLR